MKGLVKCFKLQQTRSSTRITSNDRHNTCHAKLSKCCGKLYPSSAIHPSPFCCCCLPPWGKQCIGGCLWLVSVSITHSSNGRAKKLYQDFHTARTDERTDEWMDGWMDRWKDERKNEEGRAADELQGPTPASTSAAQAARCCWKATTVFIQFSPDVANALKTFRPRPSKRAKRKY